MEEQQQPRRTRRKRQTLLNTTPLLLCIVAIGVVYLLTGCFGLNIGTDNRPTDTTPPLDTSESTTDSTPPATDPSVPDTTDATEEPTEATTEPTTEAPTEPPVKTFTTVDSSYFDDALFIGDSRTNGLEIYDPPSHGADFFCGTSMTIFGVLDSDASVNGVSGLRNVLQAKQYGKIYIMFGINECGYDTDYFISAYRNVIDTIRELQPNAIIYVQSILYVTQKKESNMSVFSSDNLKEKNGELALFDNGEDIFYLEVNDALNDGTDHLPSEYTGDGVHLYANFYYLWRDYLYEHAIVDDAHPWSPPEPETEPEAATTVPELD